MPERVNHLREAIEARRFVYSAELVLGRDHEVGEAEAFIKEASACGEGIRVISVTDLPGGNPALPPESFVSFIREHGLTPIAHLTGKDGNRSFVEARLHAMARLGVENILALTGDAQKEGFAGRGKPVHDLDSVLILWLIQALRSGLEYKLGSRAAHTTPFEFFPGAVVNPFKVREPDLMMQLYKLQLKIASGAKFIITQLGFNLRKLVEVKQYLKREGLDSVPVLANVYVPTATIARMMQGGEVAGCVIPEALIARLEKEKKPQRLERAALLAAAAKDLGFAGAHVGGFGLTHRDFLTIIERADAVGGAWRDHLDELNYSWPGEFYLFPVGRDGLSDGKGTLQTTTMSRHPSWKQRFSEFVHKHLVDEKSAAARFFAAKIKHGEEAPKNSWRHGLWYTLLEPATVWRKAALGCVSCGDCIQDHLNYAGCSMRWCYKELRNGPCGGSRVDGSCEARPELPCIWNLVYLSSLAAGDDPKKFARTVIPPRDWCLDRTNALANRLVGLDNVCKRAGFQPPVPPNHG